MIFFLDDALDFENHQTFGRVLLVWAYTTNYYMKRFLSCLADTSVHSKTARQHGATCGASCLDSLRSCVFYDCLVLSYWEISIGSGLGNDFASEGIQPIFSRVFVVDSGSFSGCTKEKESCCNKAMLCLGRILATTEKMEGRRWDVGEIYYNYIWALSLCQV